MCVMAKQKTLNIWIYFFGGSYPIFHFSSAEESSDTRYTNKLRSVSRPRALFIIKNMRMYYIPILLFLSRNLLFILRPPPAIYFLFQILFCLRIECFLFFCLFFNKKVTFVRVLKMCIFYINFICFTLIIYLPYIRNINT